MTLRPEEDITKILLSTPSYLVGEYEEDDLLLSIAFNRSSPYDPSDPEHFILTVKTSPLDRSRSALPDYTAYGDLFSIYLSILYGKRFDNHGLVESIGIFWLPNYLPFGDYDPILPFNSRKPRPDLEIPLSLAEIKHIAPLLHEGQVDSRFQRFLLSAGRFYLQALQHAKSQPEIAFLDLITCGEILSNFFEYDQDDLLDKQIKMDLVRITNQIEDGDVVARRIRSGLRGIKRRFTKTILGLLNPYFFQQSEAKEPWGALKESDISVRIKAAYDLRSRYVHTGDNFGWWTTLRLGLNNEISLGRPVIEDKELEKILVKSPTFIGMERIMRFCLLRFMHLNGIFIDLKLEGKGLKMTEEAAEDR